MKRTFCFILLLVLVDTITSAQDFPPFASSSNRKRLTDFVAGSAVITQIQMHIQTGSSEDDLGRASFDWNPLPEKLEQEPVFKGKTVYSNPYFYITVENGVVQQIFRRDEKTSEPVLGNPVGTNGVCISFVTPNPNEGMPFFNYYETPCDPFRSRLIGTFICNGRDRYTIKKGDPVTDLIVAGIKPPVTERLTPFGRDFLIEYDPIPITADNLRWRSWEGYIFYSKARNITDIKKLNSEEREVSLPARLLTNGVILTKVPNSSWSPY
jgi:hypothetical protein